MPEFTDRVELHVWLDGQPREVAVVIATRSALRALPLLDDVFLSRRDAPRARADIILPVFRSAALPWVAGTWPTHGRELASAFTVASAAASAASASAAAASAAASAAAFAADASAFAASAVFAADAATSATFASGAFASAVFASAVFASASAAAFASAADADAEVWSNISHDVTAIDGGLSPSELAGQPIWMTGREIPNWAMASWQNLKRHLVAADEGWEVWTEWYEARLAGRPTYPNLSAKANEEIELARALIPNEMWEAGPAAVNAEIARIVARVSEREQGALKQDPLGARIISRGAHLVFDDSPIGSECDDPVTGQLHEQVRDRARRLSDMAQRVTNLNPALTAAATQYAKVVDQEIENVAANIGTVWSLSVSLGNLRDQDTTTHSEADGFGETLPTDIRATLDDLILISGPFVRRFEIGRELDDELAKFEDRHQRHSTAKVVFNLVVRHGVVEENAQAVLSVSGKAGDGNGVHATKSRGWFGNSLKNIAIVAAVGLPMYIARPSADKIGERLAESQLTEKLGDWAVEGSDQILQLFEGAPPDQRGAVEEGLKKLRELRKNQPPDT